MHLFSGGVKAFKKDVLSVSGYSQRGCKLPGFFNTTSDLYRVFDCFGEVPELWVRDKTGVGDVQASTRV